MVWLVLVLALLSAASEADQPPNIIFILADDLVRSHFFCFLFSCKSVLGGGLLLLSVKNLPTSQHLILVVILIKNHRS